MDHSANAAEAIELLGPVGGGKEPSASAAEARDTTNRATANTRFMVIFLRFFWYGEKRNAPLWTVYVLVRKRAAHFA
jgi:hypothetical protein